MAVNSFNPRLFSSSSSENDVDEVFRHKGSSVVPVGGSLPIAKSRCYSEPVYQNGKEVGNKDELKTFGKGSALSDSSNVVRQRGRFTTFSGSENPCGSDAKTDCSPVFEEASHLSSDRTDKSALDNIFPEPECIREAPKDTYRFSILLEEEETMDDLLPNLGISHDLEESEFNEFNDDLNNDDLRVRPLENDVFYMRDVAFGSTDGDAGLRIEDQQGLEDYDDDSYPEKEHIPSGYVSYATQEPPYTSYPWEVPRTVLPEYSDIDLDKFPELPDDLIKDADVYPEMQTDFGSLTPALIPHNPFGPPPDVKMKMKLLFGEDC